MKKFLKSLIISIIATVIVVTAVYAATTIGTNITSSGTLLIGNSANITDVPQVKAIISQGDTGWTDNEPDYNNFALFTEGVASSGHEGYGVIGVGKGYGVETGGGVAGIGKVNNTADASTVYGVGGISEDTHAGGMNIGILGMASGAATNYSFLGMAGDIYNAGNLSITGSASILDNVVMGSTTGGNAGGSFAIFDNSGYARFGIDADQAYQLNIRNSSDTTVFSVESDGDFSNSGTFTSSATGTLGWSVVSGADTACTSTCTSACVYGQDSTTKNIVNCSDASADTCVCAGGS